MGAAEDCSFGAQPYKPDCKHFNRPLAAAQLVQRKQTCRRMSRSA
jgi:hypothetical protein